MLFKCLKRFVLQRLYYIPYVDVIGSLKSGVNGGANVNIIDSADIAINIANPTLS